jgi:D-3-phosphoglycerate dehydrogenase
MALTVALIDKTPSVLVEKLTALGYQCDDVHQLPFEEIATRLSEYTGIIMRSRFTLDKAFIDRCTHLKFVARMGIGLEHVDVDYAEQKGIRVLNSPEGSRDTVAEHTLGLILGLLHYLQQANLQIREGIWDRKTNQGHELRHRTVGIIGYGNIGSAVADRLKVFGCKIMAYDKYKSGFGHEDVEEVSLAYLQQHADVVTVHIPYEADNHHFVNRDFLAAFQNPIFLINTARGLVLNTADLVDALKSRTSQRCGFGCIRI